MAFTGGLLMGSGGFGAISSVASALFGSPGAMPAQAPGNSMMIENPGQSQASADRQRKRSQGAGGRAETIKTGPQGLGEISDDNLSSKSLLGY